MPTQYAGGTDDLSRVRSTHFQSVSGASGPLR